MIVRTQTLAAVNALLVTGCNAASGYWDGPGINSSTAASEPNGLTALGVLDNAEYGYTDFAGVTGLLGTGILVKYTWTGDADLNGVVNGDDFTLFAAGFNGQTGTLRPGGARRCLRNSKTSRRNSVAAVPRRPPVRLRRWDRRSCRNPARSDCSPRARSVCSAGVGGTPAARSLSSIGSSNRAGGHPSFAKAMRSP